MELITILNRCHRFRGFVYEHARFSADKKSIEVVVRPRKGSAAVCSRCHQQASGYDQLAEQRFEFIPLWGFFVCLLYAMRRVECRRCGVVAVEEVPWGDGKRTLTKAYMLFLARWARRLSWKETAEAFRTSWDKVLDAVEHVVTWGLEHRTLGQIDANGVDEIQYAKGHKYLTLVYQIDIGITRLLWVGRERTIESFPGILCHHGPGGHFQNLLRLLGYVGAVFEGHPGQMFRGAAYSRPVPHCRQNEQRARRGSRRGSSADETRRARPGTEEVPLVAAQTRRGPRR
jgi:hypothetical protein